MPPQFSTEHHGILINVAKSVFGAPSLDFLGHHMDKDGIRPLEEKVWAIREFPQPTTQRKLREFLGLVNFYHRFLPTLQPLNTLLTDSKSSSKAVVWSNSVETAFTTIKEVLAKATLLAHPEPNAPTCIMTDASDVNNISMVSGVQYRISQRLSSQPKPVTVRLTMSC